MEEGLEAEAVEGDVVVADAQCEATAFERGYLRDFLRSFNNRPKVCIKIFFSNIYICIVPNIIYENFFFNSIYLSRPLSLTHMHTHRHTDIYITYVEGGREEEGREKGGGGRERGNPMKRI